MQGAAPGALVSRAIDVRPGRVRQHSNVVRVMGSEGETFICAGLKRSCVLRKLNLADYVLKVLSQEKFMSFGMMHLIWYRLGGRFTFSVLSRKKFNDF